VKLIADFCIVPIGTGVSISEYVAACQRILEGAGLKTHLHAFGTNVEGDWDLVVAAIKKCHEKVHEMGAARIMTTIKFSTRTDREQSLEEKVESVRSKLKK
jgi:uncharacterized protein (TIGR00106 family)